MSTAPGTIAACQGPQTHPLAARLRRGGLWTVGGRSLGMAVVLGSHIFLARILPKMEYAAFFLASTIVVCFSMAAMFGINSLICRYLAESLGVKDQARARTAIRLTARLAMISIGVGGLGGWLCVGFLGNTLFHVPQLARSAGLLALWIMLLAISQILAETFRGLHDLRMASLLAGVNGGLVSNVLFLLTLVVASAFVPIHFRDVVLIATLSLVLPIAVAAFFLRRTWPRDADLRGTSAYTLRPLSAMTVTREAFLIMLVQVMSFGIAQLDIWIVGAFCSGRDLADYGVARRLSLLVAIPLTQVSLVVASSISELHARGDRQRLESVLRGAATIAFFTTSVMAVGLIVFPGVVLDWTFGPTFQAGAQPLRILCLGQIVFVLTGACGPVLMMTGHQQIPLCALFIAAPFYLLAPWVVTRFGPEGLAAVSALVITIQNLFQWIAVRTLLGIRTNPSFSSRTFRALRFDANAVR